MAEFVDTNVWIYAHLAGGVEQTKSAAARALLGKLDDPVVSAQVLAEYSAVMLRNRLPEIRVRENVATIMAMCRILPVSEDTVQAAWDVRDQYRYSYWDCQMIASALEGGCEVLVTEDLQNGQRIGGRLVVRDPFVQ